MMQNAELTPLHKILLSYISRNYGVVENSVLWKYAMNLFSRFDNGSICIDVLESDLAELKKSKAIGEFCPLVLHNGKLYIQKYFEYQKIIIEKVRELQASGNLKIISGGPGTGKTTSLTEILTEKTKNNSALKILLTAPTGKAALRMKFAGIKPLTLHRLLGYIPLSPNFKHNRENPLNADIIVIDESSMVDLPMMAKLCDALPKNCELYLLGDKRQLPSVECGSVFADLCDSAHLKPSIKILTKSYRFSDTEGIGKLSKDIQDIENSGEPKNAIAKILENLKREIYAPQVKFCDDDFEKLYRNGFLFNSELNNLFNAKDVSDAFATLRQFQILCATHRGKFGTERINAKLRKIAKEKQAKYTPIIITENNYEYSLFNGDIGLLENNGVAHFKNDIEENSKFREFPKLLLPKFESAFAITIHKSQGSEYGRIAMLIPNTAENAEQKGDLRDIITRELIYTGITRAREKAIIFCTGDSFSASLAKSVFRASGIAEILSGDA